MTNEENKEPDMSNKAPEHEPESQLSLNPNISRRRFLSFLGAAGTVLLGSNLIDVKASNLPTLPRPETRPDTVINPVEIVGQNLTDSELKIFEAIYQRRNPFSREGKEQKAWNDGPVTFGFSIPQTQALVEQLRGGYLAQELNFFLRRVNEVNPPLTVNLSDKGKVDKGLTDQTTGEVRPEAIDEELPPVTGERSTKRYGQIQVTLMNGQAFVYYKMAGGEALVHTANSATTDVIAYPDGESKFQVVSVPNGDLTSAFNSARSIDLSIRAKFIIPGGQQDTKTVMGTVDKNNELTAVGVRDEGLTLHTLPKPIPVPESREVALVLEKVAPINSINISPYEKALLAEAGGVPIKDGKAEKEFAFPITLKRVNNTWQLPEKYIDPNGKFYDIEKTEVIRDIRSFVDSRQAEFGSNPGIQPVLILASDQAEATGQDRLVICYKSVELARETNGTFNPDITKGKVRSVEAGSNDEESGKSTVEIAENMRGFEEEFVLRVKQEYDENGQKKPGLKEFLQSLNIQVDLDQAVILTVLKGSKLPVRISNGKNGIVLDYPQVRAELKRLRNAGSTMLDVKPTPAPLQLVSKSDFAKYPGAEVSKEMALRNEVTAEMVALEAHINESPDRVNIQVSQTLPPRESKNGLVLLVPTKTLSENNMVDASHPNMFSDPEVADRLEIGIVTLALRKATGNTTLYTFEKVSQNPNYYLNLLRGLDSGNLLLNGANLQFDRTQANFLDLKQIQFIEMGDEIKGNGTWHFNQAGNQDTLSKGMLFGNDGGVIDSSKAVLLHFRSNSKPGTDTYEFLAEQHRNPQSAEGIDKMQSSIIDIIASLDIATSSDKKYYGFVVSQILKKYYADDFFKKYYSNMR